MRTIFLALTLAACTPAPQLTVPYSEAPGRSIEIQGAGISPQQGGFEERAYASSTGLCEATHSYAFGSGELAFGFLASATDLSASLPSETDIDAPIASRVTLPDGRNGVLASGTAQLIDDGDTFQVTLTGSRWCELELDPVTERQVISTCTDEEIEVSYTVTIIDERGREGVSCPAEAHHATDEGYCRGVAQPWRCVGDPIPPPQD